MNTPSALPDWWYVANGQRLGPVSDQELQRLLIEGTLGPNSLVWKQGMERTWRHASQVQALAPLLASLPPELPREPTEPPAREPTHPTGATKHQSQARRLNLRERTAADREVFLRDRVTPSEPETNVTATSHAMKPLFESGFRIIGFLLLLLIYFPGGTIMMALSCRSYRLDGWDWVLSVIIPGYGIATALFSSAC